MGTSLFNLLITNATPGVVWLHNGATRQLGSGTSEIVVGDVANLQAHEIIDSAYVQGVSDAYVGHIAFSAFVGLRIWLSTAANNKGGGTGPQFTDAAEENLGFALRIDGAAEHMWPLNVLTANDNVEPYDFSFASVAAAGTANTSTFRNTLGAATNVQLIFVDRTSPYIDWATLTTIDAPLAPTAPTLTALTTSITATLSADPTSDATITSRDIQWKRTVDPDSSFVVVDSITSPHTIASLAAGTEYAVQWRAVSAAGDGAWSPSRTITTPSVDLIPTAPTIPDQTATVGTAFSYTLPLATGGDAPVTASSGTLPAGLTLTNGVISGTPTSAGSTSVTIAYTDADGDSDTASFDFVVAAAESTYTIGDTLRLDSLDDLDSIFDRFYTGSSSGRWAVDPTRSTGSGGTGPGTNSSGPYVYVETSGGGNLGQIGVRSAINIKSNVMSAWSGAGRQIAIRASIAGDGSFSVGGGLILEGRDSSGDTWATIELIEGWAYSSTGYTTGGSLTDNNGDAQTIAQDGGWVDFEVAIPDSHTEVRIRIEATNAPVLRHDAALWQVRLFSGPVNVPATVTMNTPVQTIDTGASVVLNITAGGNSPLAYLWSATGGTFTSTTAQNPTWNAPSPTNQTSYTLTVVVTDNDNETATASVVITVRAVPITDTNPTANITTPNQTISAGSSITLALTAGHGGDGQALTYLWSATGGTFNSTSTQNPVWTSPSPTNETQYILTARVTDEDGNFVTDTVTITVEAAAITDTNPTVSISTATGQTVDFGTAFPVASTQGTGGDSDILTGAWSATPAGGAFAAPANANTTFSASPSSQTTFILRRTITDENSNTATDLISLNVRSADLMPVAPTILDQVATVGRQYSQTLAVGTGGDTPLTYAATGLPPGLTFTSATRVIAGTPTTANTYTVTYTVTDNDGDSDTASFDIVVAAAGVSPLAFSDWSPPAGSETRLLMLVSRGANNEWYREGNSGSLIDNSNALFDDLLAPNLQVNRIRWNGSVFVLNRSGSGSFSDQLSGTDPPLGEGLLHVVTADGAITLAISLIAGIGDGFVSFRPTAQSVIDFLEGVGLGDRFLFAFTIPGVTNTAPTISITTAGSLVDGAASVSLAGAVGDAEDDDGNVGLTVTASRGTITNLTHTGSGWTATWTAPAVTAAQQTATITATATDSESLTATATTDFMVRANVGPTVMITAPTSAQTVDGGDAINLTATASAPEAGQTVTIAWSSNIGTFTDSGGTTARWVAPAITNAVQTATITATATDALNETATDTLAVSVRANTAPSVSIDTSAQTVDGGGTLALTASVSDPEGQTLTHLWEITSGAGSITNSTSLSATLNLPAATTSVQTIAIRITTTDPLNLTGTDTVTITVRVADAVSLLVLSDFVAPDGTEIACSGLFTSGVPTNSGGVERLWGRIPRTPWGTLTDGNFTFDGVSINEIRRAANGSNFRLLKNGGTGFNSYFATDGGGENARFYILTAEITISFGAVANILAPSGGNFFNFTVPDTAGWRSALSSIVEGDRFIMGWTVPSTAPDLMPVAPTIPDRAGTVGTAFSYTLPLATGGDTPITTTADVLPGGLSLTNGVISGTPTAAGSTTVTITYTDNDGDTDTASFDFTVAAAADLMPVAPTIPDRTATVGTAFSYTLPLATSGDAPVTATADTLPAGLTLTSGAISGTPTATGTTTVTITYTDNDGDSDTASFDFVVSAAMAEVATLFIVDSSGDELWEVTDPSSPGTSVLRGNFPGGLTVPTGISSHDGSLWIIDNTGDELWEVTDPSNPGAAVLRGDFPANLSSPRGITSHSGSLWIVDDTGDELWELANPSSPGTAVLRGEFPFSLSFSAALTSHGGSLFITDRSGGELWELADPSSPASAVLRGTFPSGLTSQRGITSHDGSLFIVDDSGNELWELADPSNPGTAVNRGSFPSGLNTPSGITSHNVAAEDLFPAAPTIPDRTATAGNAFSYTLPLATGGDDPITTTADQLPGGLSLTSGVISGTPTAAGTTTVTITYTDADGDSDTAAFDFVVAAADLMPVAPTVADQTATVGTAYSQTLPVFTGGDGTLTYTATPLPAGLTFNATTRLISGTPTTVETTTVVYEAEDDDGDTASVSFDIAVGAADLLPTAAAISNQSATFGTAFSLTFDAATGGNTPLTYAVSGNPAWLTLSGRTLSGTPTATGTHTITITVTDSDGDTDTESFVLTVGTVPNTPPTISIATAAATVNGGQLVAIAGAVGDAEDDDGNVTVTVTASRGTISNLLHTGSGWMADWTAPAVAAAQQSAVITATAEDSDGLTATTTRTWTVRANQAPTVTIGTAGGDVTGGSTTTLTATASDPEGQTLTSLWEITSGRALSASRPL